MPILFQSFGMPGHETFAQENIPRKNKGDSDKKFRVLNLLRDGMDRNPHFFFGVGVHVFVLLS